MNREIAPVFDAMDTVLRPDAVAAWTEYQTGYVAYLDRRGPGLGLMRTAGWLQAWRDERAELRQRADERIDANDYQWQY